MSGIIVRRKEDLLVVEFAESSILDQEQVENIGRELRAVPDKENVTKILLDMQNVQLMSSAMIGQFIKMRAKCEQKSIKLKLCCLSAELLNLFKVTKLNKVFDIYPSREKALKAFGL